jgi:UDP-N-acetylmuramate: L-alanyl-gamma-D-glutamyl-meso-diaminopimelate ligase
MNALAALAAATAAGADPVALLPAFGGFASVKRRMELIGTTRGVTVYDDFAHHPTAIGETLAGVRSAFPDSRVWAIFEPRSATSCRRIFQDDFARALARADHVILPAVFRSSLPEDQRLSAEKVVSDLQAQGVDARYIPATAEIVKAVARESTAGDIVVVMSNGGFDDIHTKLLSALEARGTR